MNYFKNIFSNLKPVSSIVRNKSKTDSQHMPFPLHQMPDKSSGNRYVVRQMATTVTHTVEQIQQK